MRTNVKKTPSIKKPAPIKKIEVAQAIKEEEPLILDQVHEEVSVSKNISQKPQEARVAPSARKMAVESNIDLSKIQTKEVDESILTSSNLYEFELPKAKKKIKFKLLTHKDETDINAEIAALQRLQKGKSDVSNDVTTRLKYMIQEVDGNQDRGFINSFVLNGLLALDTRALRAYVKQLSPDMDMKFNFVSNITGEEEALDIPFGVSFFYPSEWL